ncbi:MAG: CDP-alcohol phosphatidyltransferase family protein [Victivallales bacterium]|nr:CDP-alcohol phosphatidyltransferase family protein [Victivallales bacterium]
MISNWLIVIIILSFLGLERLIVTTTTKNPKYIKWYRKLPFLHPNGISVLRLPMGFIAAALAAYNHWVAATLWFAVFMITDLSDGTIARNCDLQTEMGKWLDPLSDKFMYFPVLFYLSCGSVFSFGLQILPFPWVVAFIVIDMLGQASRLVVKKKAANSFGKVKTALVTILLSLISLDQIDPLKFGDFTVVNNMLVYCMTISATILAFLSFYCKIIPDIWYANSFTLANFLCGIAAIVCAFTAYRTDKLKYYIFCYILVFIGQFFDLFDGRMARKYGSTPHGPMFDDIADATSFGLGIASLIFCNLAFSEDWIPPWAAALIAVFYACCLFYRLYRFLHPTRQMPPGVFQGMPAPAGAILAGSSVLFATLFEHPAVGLLSAGMVIFTSLLMISNIPYRHFGQVLWPTMPRGLKMIIFILMIIFVCFVFAHKCYRPAFVWWCFGISLAYALYGINWPFLKKHPPENKP